MPTMYIGRVWERLVNVLTWFLNMIKTVWIWLGGGVGNTAGWQNVNPPEESCDFLDVFMIDMDTGFAVGRKGIIFKTTDCGITWAQLAKNITTEDLHGVHFTNANLGYVVGNAGTILRTDDGGVTWYVQQTSYSYVGSLATFRDVFVIDSQKAIVVGQSDQYVPTPDYLSVYYPGVILLTFDGGVTWSPPDEMPKTATRVNAIDMASSATGTAVGGTGTVNTLYFENNTRFILRTEDGGRTWSFQSDTAALYGGYPHWDVDLHDATHGIAVSVASPPIHTSDGETWRNSCRHGCQIVVETGVCFLDATLAIHVGYGFGAVGIMTTQAGIMKSFDGGASWWIVDYCSYSNLQKVSFGNSDKGVAVGLDNNVIRSVDKGDTWQASSQFRPGIGGDNWQAIFFIDDNIGYAVGKAATIIKTTDGGMTWNRIGNIGYYMNQLLSLYFQDAQNGFIGGDGFFRTTDGGVTLQQFLLSDDGQTLSIPETAPSCAILSPQVNTIAFNGAQYGVLGASEGIFQTTDLGLTWHKVLDQRVYDMQWIDSQHVIALRDNLIIRSSDCGLTWTTLELPCPGEWTAGSLHVIGLTAVSFPKGQSLIGYAVGTMTVIKTIDGGSSWRNIELSEDMEGAWCGVFFVDVNNGWIVGTVAEIGQYEGLPRSRCLHTSDGGETWEEQDTPSQIETPETMGGNGLNDVVFMNRLVGTAVGDSGTILHTITGGD